MNYAIRKRRPDNRRNTCGFETPDGFVNVIELTLYDATNLINLLYHGYIVEETEICVGIHPEHEYELFGGTPLNYIKLGLVNPTMANQLKNSDLDHLPDM